jgi:hypothetical protein
MARINKKVCAIFTSLNHYLKFIRMTNLNEFMLLFRFEPTNEQPTQEQLEQIQKS